MTYEIVLGLAVFALVSSITPGPNNLMLMASGANFGYLRTLPHMAGVVVGFTTMLFLVGIGLIKIFEDGNLLPEIFCYGDTTNCFFNRSVNSGHGLHPSPCNFAC